MTTLTETGQKVEGSSPQAEPEQPALPPAPGVVFFASSEQQQAKAEEALEKKRSKWINAVAAFLTSAGVDVSGADWLEALDSSVQHFQNLDQKQKKLAIQEAYLFLDQWLANPQLLSPGDVSLHLIAIFSQAESLRTKEQKKKISSFQEKLSGLYAAKPGETQEGVAGNQASQPSGQGETLAGAAPPPLPSPEQRIELSPAQQRMSDLVNQYAAQFGLDAGVSIGMLQDIPNLLETLTIDQVRATLKSGQETTQAESAEVALLRPSEVADSLGISAATLRRWTSRFEKFFNPQARAESGGHRRYTDQDLNILRKIKSLIEESLTYEQVAENLSSSTPPTSSESTALVPGSPLEVAIGVLRSLSQAPQIENPEPLEPATLGTHLAVLIAAMLTDPPSEEEIAKLIMEYQKKTMPKADSDNTLIVDQPGEGEEASPEQQAQSSLTSFLSQVDERDGQVNDNRVQFVADALIGQVNQKNLHLLVDGGIDLVTLGQLGLNHNQVREFISIIWHQYGGGDSLIDNRLRGGTSPISPDMTLGQLRERLMIDGYLQEEIDNVRTIQSRLVSNLGQFLFEGQELAESDRLLVSFMVSTIYVSLLYSSPSISFNDNLRFFRDLLTVEEPIGASVLLSRLGITASSWSELSTVIARNHPTDQNAKFDFTYTDQATLGDLRTALRAQGFISDQSDEENGEVAEERRPDQPPLPPEAAPASFDAQAVARQLAHDVFTPELSRENVSPENLAAIVAVAYEGVVENTTEFSQAYAVALSGDQLAFFDCRNMLFNPESESVNVFNRLANPITQLISSAEFGLAEGADWQTGHDRFAQLVTELHRILSERKSQAEPVPAMDLRGQLYQKALSATELDDDTRLYLDPLAGREDGVDVLNEIRDKAKSLNVRGYADELLEKQEQAKPTADTPENYLEFFEKRVRENDFKSIAAETIMCPYPEIRTKGIQILIDHDRTSELKSILEIFEDNLDKYQGEAVKVTEEEIEVVRSYLENQRKETDFIRRFYRLLRNEDASKQDQIDESHPAWVVASIVADELSTHDLALTKEEDHWRSLIRINADIEDIFKAAERAEGKYENTLTFFELGITEGVWKRIQQRIQSRFPENSFSFDYVLGTNKLSDFKKALESAGILSVRKNRKNRNPIAQLGVAVSGLLRFGQGAPPTQELPPAGGESTTAEVAARPEQTPVPSPEAVPSVRQRVDAWLRSRPDSQAVQAIRRVPENWKMKIFGQSVKDAFDVDSISHMVDDGKDLPRTYVHYNDAEEGEVVTTVTKTSPSALVNDHAEAVVERLPLKTSSLKKIEKIIKNPDKYELDTEPGRQKAWDEIEKSFAEIAKTEENNVDKVTARIAAQYTGLFEKGVLPPAAETDDLSYEEASQQLKAFYDNNKDERVVNVKQARRVLFSFWRSLEDAPLPEDEAEALLQVEKYNRLLAFAVGHWAQVGWLNQNIVMQYK